MTRSDLRVAPLTMTLAITLLWALAALPSSAGASNPAAAMERAIAEAEAGLQVDEVQIADSR